MKHLAGDEERWSSKVLHSELKSANDLSPTLISQLLIGIWRKWLRSIIMVMVNEVFKYFVFIQLEVFFSFLDLF